MTFAAAWSEEQCIWRESLEEDVSEKEVGDAFLGLPKKKACEPDQIFNEHLIDARVLVPHFTCLLIACLHQGQIPKTWREGIMILIPKGKGSLTDPKAWRGICKKSCVYKLLVALLVSRLTSYLEHMKVLPSAVRSFVDFRAAFDAGSRSFFLLELA